MMRRELCHLWGPFSIYSYGLALAAAILLFVWLCLRHPRRAKIISTEKFIETVGLSLIVGLIGARLLFIVNSYDEFESIGSFFSLWNGGLSLLGGIIAIVLVMPFYLKSINVPVLPLLDIAAIHAPLLQAIARLGCLMAGCCYGKPTDLPWAIVYSDQQSEAPLNIALHPTQIYTSIAMLLVFAFFYFYLQKKVTIPGQLVMAYLMTEGAVRFSVDFFRDDQEYFSGDMHHTISAHQWLALGLFTAGLVGLILIRYTNNERYNNAQ
ncbi:MAG: prolipoprotein diacylglyceryl transferase [Candidatus Dependentiae bacterium]|nr:prolipoprotein diacylglyceryl transferase [Candidatus Dependentiae bacterium]